VVRLEMPHLKQSRSILPTKKPDKSSDCFSRLVVFIPRLFAQRLPLGEGQSKDFAPLNPQPRGLST